MKPKKSMTRWAVNFVLITIGGPILIGLVVVGIAMTAKALGFIA